MRAMRALDELHSLAIHQFQGIGAADPAPRMNNRSNDENPSDVLERTASVDCTGKNARVKHSASTPIVALAAVRGNR